MASGARYSFTTAFCAGVDRAIKIVELTIEQHGPPVYVRHEIVHNKFVVDRLRDLGAVFVEELEEVPDGVPVVFSAHGVPKSVPLEAQNRGLDYLDATCPLVSKVHRQAQRLIEAGRHILFIGHEGHPEVIGTLGQVPPGSMTLIETIADVAALSPVDPENLVISGHPWHPMCKTRLGLHLHEVLRLAPEGLAAAEIHAVDVREGMARSAGAFAEMCGTLFPAAAPGWLRMPVHRLQRRRLPRLLGALWGEAVRPAPVAPVPARALLSLRTVATAALHIKLSTDMHTTSARRQISPMSSHNGPRVGALLDTIAAADPHVRRGLRLQHEPASAGLDPQALGGRNDLAGSLGVIFRKDLGEPTSALANEAGGTGEAVAWVCAALGERWPGVPGDMSPRTGSRHGPSSGVLLHRSEGDPLLRAITSAYPTPMAALRHYVDLLVPPALRLCTAHGVALEMHLQNTLVVHRRGRLCGFIVRDLGGIRIHRGRLTAAGHAPDLAAGSFTVTDDLAETQTKLAHTLLHAHLGTVFAWTADLLRADEAALWAHTRTVIDGCLAAWANARPQLASACTEDRAVLLAPVVRAKALLRMRIDERISDYAYTRVSSPFEP